MSPLLQIKAFIWHPNQPCTAYYVKLVKEPSRSQHKALASKPKSTHCATAPNRVWSWDISYLPGPAKGIYFYLYLILDIFSREIVCWEVWNEESAEHAGQLIQRATMAQNIMRERTIPLVLHSDNGSPMKGASMLETLYQLGITPSRSRPRVSNDNPYSEAMFRTCKYCPDYPVKGFTTLDNSRVWVKDFVDWYTISIIIVELNFLRRISVIVVKAKPFWKSGIRCMKLLKQKIQNVGRGK